MSLKGIHVTKACDLFVEMKAKRDQPKSFTFFTLFMSTVIQDSRLNFSVSYCIIKWIKMFSAESDVFRLLWQDKRMSFEFYSNRNRKMLKGTIFKETSLCNSIFNNMRTTYARDSKHLVFWLKDDVEVTVSVQNMIHLQDSRRM